MKRILWMSSRVPFDGVPHAGGKIHNFLLKTFKRKANFDFFLISFARNQELEHLDLHMYGISSNLIVVKFERSIKYWAKKFLNTIFFFTYFLGLDSFWSMVSLLCAVTKYKRKYGKPDIIILQWTSVVNQIWWLKIIFPFSKYVVIEEDVSFLKKERALKGSSFGKKLVMYPFFIASKKIELYSLKSSNLVVLNNEKDCNLVIAGGVCKNKTFVCHPYFQKIRCVNAKHTGLDILFYGAMNRPENFKSAIWFLENVFPKIEPLGFRFVVIGNKPDESIKKYENGKNVFIKGFVEDVSPYFENCLCLVAPLLLGAGVKIKVIEAMSCGVPVLTNEIGIEGIPAEDGKDFFFCRNVEDYRKRILELFYDENLRLNMSKNARMFIQCNFNYQQDADKLYEAICEMGKNK